MPESWRARAEDGHMVLRTRPHQMLRCGCSPRLQVHASGVDEMTPGLDSCLRDAWDVLFGCRPELLHIFVPQGALRSTSAWVDVSSSARPWMLAPCVLNRQASSVQNAANRASESTGLPLPCQPRSLRGLLIVMAKAHAAQFPPEAGALSDELCQLDAWVFCALCKLFHCARAIEPYHQGIIEEPYGAGAVYQLLFSELG